MTGSGRGDERLAQVREGFDAVARGELDAVDGLLAEDVRWTGSPPGPGDCLSRREVRQMLETGLEEGAFGSVELFAVDADRVAVVTSWHGMELVHVLTFAGDRAIFVQACRDRAGIGRCRRPRCRPPATDRGPTRAAGPRD